MRFMTLIKCKENTALGASPPELMQAIGKLGAKRHRPGCLPTPPDSGKGKARATTGGTTQLYVYSSQSPVRLTLGQIARLTYSAEPAVIHRANQYRAINVAALPAPGRLAEEVTAPLMPTIREFERQLPPGYWFEIVGELKEQIKGQTRSLIVALASLIAIYLALVFQFRNAVKPFIVFAGIPFGAVGAFASLWVTGM